MLAKNLEALPVSDLMQYGAQRFSPCDCWMLSRLIDVERLYGSCTEGSWFFREELGVLLKSILSIELGHSACRAANAFAASGMLTEFE